MFNVFHTAEFFALVLGPGLILPVFINIFAGMLYHLALDTVHRARMKQLPAGAVFYLQPG